MSSPGRDSPPARPPPPTQGRGQSSQYFLKEQGVCPPWEPHSAGRPLPPPKMVPQPAPSATPQCPHGASPGSPGWANPTQMGVQVPQVTQPGMSSLP